MTQVQLVNSLARKVFEMANGLGFQVSGEQCDVEKGAWFKRAVAAVITEADLTGEIKNTWVRSKFNENVRFAAYWRIVDHRKLAQRKADWGW